MSTKLVNREYKPIRLDGERWLEIRRQIVTDFSPAVAFTRSAMKRELGFTVRELDYHGSIVELDFFDEQQKSYFILKYSDYINKPDDS